MISTNMQNIPNQGYQRMSPNLNRPLLADFVDDIDDAGAIDG
jgi:hypothetical protein